MQFFVKLDFENFIVVLVDSVISILYVEDNYGFVKLVKEILSLGNSEFEVENSPDLETAVSLLKDNSFDLILLDLGLPDSQGVETYFEIKKISGDLPIIIFSSSQNRFNIDKLLKNGAEDYIVKDSDEMFSMKKTIQRILESR